MPKATPSKNPHPSEAPAAEPLRWGILATGRIARTFAKDLRDSGAGRLVACGSRTIEGAKAFASAFAIPRAYGSYGELARDPDVEAVYVATPHPFHFNDALACLKNGKAVLCEKPLTLNAHQAAALFEAAEQNGVFLMEALWTVFLPALVQARKWWASGAIGEVRLVQADFGGRSTFDPKGRLFDPELGGGALLDIGIYPLVLAQLFAGNKVPRIKATARMTATGVDETTLMVLDWHSGLKAHLSCSIAHDLPATARIHGTKGTITLPDFWKARTAILETDAGRTEFEDSRRTAGYDFEARAVTEAVRAGRTEDALVSKAFSLRLAATMDAVRKQIGLVYPGE
jgi:predicted dehydrogenase